MTITLPTPLRTYQYRPLTVFSLLDTDTDRVLPQLFEMCVKGGRSSRSRTDARDFVGYRHALLRQRARGRASTTTRPAPCSTAGCARAWSTWARSGGARTGEQMLAVAPLTLAAYRAGLPKERDPPPRHRRRRLPAAAADVGRARRPDSAGAARPQLRELVTRTVGRGLGIGPGPTLGAAPGRPGAARHRRAARVPVRRGLRRWATPARSTSAPRDSPLPGVAADLGAMLLAHLRAYGERSARARADVELRGADGARACSPSACAPTPRPGELLRTGERPARPGRRAGAGLAAGALLRLHRRSRVRVRPDVAPLRRARPRPGPAGVPRPHDVRRRGERAAAHPRRDRAPGDAARRRPARRSSPRCASIGGSSPTPRPASTTSSPTRRPRREATEPELEFLRRVQSADSSRARQAARRPGVRQPGARPSATRSTWFWSVGGLEKPYGLLRGDARSRRSWRYAPGDELLTALLLAVFVEPGRDAPAAPRMPLRDVLDALRHRFGILVDRPPAFLDGAEARDGRHRQPARRSPAGCSCSAASTASPTTSPCRSSATPSETPDARPPRPPPTGACPSWSSTDRRPDRGRRCDDHGAGHCVRIDSIRRADAAQLVERARRPAARRRRRRARAGRPARRRRRQARGPRRAGRRAAQPQGAPARADGARRQRLGRQLAGQQLRADRRHRAARDGGRGARRGARGRDLAGRRSARWRASSAATGPSRPGPATSPPSSTDPSWDTVGAALWMVGLVPDLGGPDLVGRLARNAACVRAISRPGAGRGLGRRPADRRELQEGDVRDRLARYLSGPGRRPVRRAGLDRSAGRPDADSHLRRAGRWSNGRHRRA